MKQCSLRRIANIRRFLAALVRGGAASYDHDRKTHVCLHPDPAAVQRFLDTLDEQRTEHRLTLRRSPSRHCMNPGKSFLHVLADDVKFPLIVTRHPARRDTLVAAFFGTGGSTSNR
jgi:hypothetical protein